MEAIGLLFLPFLFPTYLPLHRSFADTREGAAWKRFHWITAGVGVSLRPCGAIDKILINGFHACGQGFGHSNI